jgi:hypothetical protein
MSETMVKLVQETRARLIDAARQVVADPRNVAAALLVANQVLYLVSLDLPERDGRYPVVHELLDLTYAALKLWENDTSPEAADAIDALLAAADPEDFAEASVAEVRRCEEDDDA